MKTVKLRSKKHFKWLFSEKSKKLKKKIKQLRIEFIKMIEDEHTNNQY